MDGERVSLVGDSGLGIRLLILVASLMGSLFNICLFWRRRLLFDLLIALFCAMGFLLTGLRLVGSIDVELAIRLWQPVLFAGYALFAGRAWVSMGNKFGH